MSPYKVALEPVLKSLQQGLGPNLVALALFGSQARGEARPESDWDLLLIARNLPDRPLQRHFYLKALLPENWRARISILAKTPAEFEARLPSLYLDIALDAVLLYDTEGYLRSRLDLLRKLIVRCGLYRKQVDGKHTWEWLNSPPADWSLTWGAEQ